MSEARPSERATLAARSMTKRDYIDFQDRSEPLAFLITFRSMERGCMGKSEAQLIAETTIDMAHQARRTYGRQMKCNEQ